MHTFQFACPPWRDVVWHLSMPLVVCRSVCPSRVSRRMSVFILPPVSSQHRNRLPVARHLMSKRRHPSVSAGDAFDSVNSCLDDVVVVTANGCHLLEPTNFRAYDCAQTLSEHCPSLADYNGQSTASLVLGTQDTGHVPLRSNILRPGCGHRN